MNIKAAVLFSALLLTSFTWAIDIKVNDSRANNFYMDALIWILDKSGADYRLIHTNHLMSSQVRKVKLVQKGEIDIMYAGTTNELESMLKPIRFPVTRGLVGHRVFIINKNYRLDYAQVKGINDLKHHSGILSYGWADKEIYEAVGLMQVEKIYADIFSNINSGSRYYFSRGVLEAYSELIDKKEMMPNLIVEDNIILRYKAAVLFFIHPENKELEEMMTRGFNKAYEDGSYIDFLYNHPLIKSSFEQANLAERLVIDIPNPFFPEASSSIPVEYWHDG